MEREHTAAERKEAEARVDYERTWSKHYIGDGAYVEFDGYYLWLTTENGVEVTNKIGIEPEVWEAFKTWVKRIEKANAALKKAREGLPG